MSSFLMDTYARLSVAFVRGEGVYLFDESGERYLDAAAGIAVASLGHAHPRLAQAISSQAHTLLHTSNMYRIPLQEKLAEALFCRTGLERAFFCNSGAEANEAALKLARLWGHDKGIEEPVVVVMEGAFHGRTLATLSASASPKVREGFSPYLPGFLFAPYGDADFLSRLARERDDICAVMLEPIQGEAGVRLPPPGYLKKVREIASHAGWLMVADEVQTGVGRTGRFLAIEHEGVKPDVLTLAKGLAGGVPIGACLSTEKASCLMNRGRHGSTFGGNPLACRAALTVLEVIEEEGLLQRAQDCGQFLLDMLKEDLASLPLVRDIRGKGLMIGVDLGEEIELLSTKALEKRLLINVTQKKTVRLLPPLVTTAAEAQEMGKRLILLLRQVGP